MATKRELLWPKEKHPITGEPFVDGVIHVNAEVREVYVGMPPARPIRDLFEVDDYGNTTFVRELTEAEFRVEMTKYRKASAAYARSGGLLQVRGQTIISGDFKTKSGATAEGVRSSGKRDGEWVWTNWK